jgi:hypothetical protein
VFRAQTQGSVGVSQLFNSGRVYISLRTGAGTEHKQNIPSVGDENFGPVGNLFLQCIQREPHKHTKN